MYQMTEQIMAANRGSKERFLASVQLQSAAVARLLTIANCARALTPETSQTLPLVGGQAVDSLRDAIADDNDNVKLELLWQIVQQDIPQLALALDRWLSAKA
ncbi:HepT-like ribonuclease domain-containing protein [Nodosilinea nodulosa]|uniref:HepT-like ribonuclease domain-containing protein n=1 Tax=Nodosilinea nodulosa TaxID=416001 RepID=UPI00036F72E7|nr:HepT-like ribonuclease domain-containing protein [Nodosilinea nodulosa]